MISSEQFAAAFIEHSGRIHRFLRARGASEEVAEELTQQTWLQAWAARQQWRGDSSFRSWLFAIAFNLYRGRFRSMIPLQLSDSWDAMYEEPFDRKIEAHQILARLYRRDAADLRRHYLEDGYSGTAFERVRVFRSLVNARRVAGP